AIILGGVLIYFSVQKWSSKLSQMSKEIEALDITKDARITVPNNPVEMTDVATAFNQLLDEQKDAIEREKQFITNASHDLKTPLAAIRGHVSLIRRRGESHPEVIPTSIDFIDKESKRLERLSNQLLTLEKKDSSSFTMLNMSEIVLDEIEKIQSLTNRMFSSRVEADSMIEARRVDVQQVIQNLLENAVKYSVESSTIEVELRTNQSELLLEVRDEGIGISDENKKRIFERFYRVDASRTSDIEGSGIGLSIVKEIIDDYQGSIMIKDNEPKGTIFLVKLPKEKMKKSSSRV
ncbi:MAG: HAMP domain-containing sensor histidine kinase, partial [Vagococcus sp.]|uniref:sensor histidine kinase n=1 Tax=Vagococcus sp. TaxID=1933889 RepID=UPI002FC9656A